MIKMMKRAILLTIVVIACGYVYLSPHRAYRSMRKAAASGDSSALSAWVNFESVRNSLKAGVKGKVQGDSGNPLAAIGAVVASALTDPMVEKLVTPGNLSLLMRGERVWSGKSEADDDLADGGDLSEYSMRYEGWHQFVVKPKKKGETRDPVQLVLHREGFMGWKLAEIRLP